MEISQFIEDLEKDKNILILSRNENKIFCRPVFGSKRLISVPTTVSPELAFLSGIIIGDGHLRKSKFGILIEMTSKHILSIVRKKFKKIFSLKAKIKLINKRKNKKQSWKIEFKSKVIWLLFNKLFDIPCGKKSGKVGVPKIIYKLENSCIREFVSGLFLADGGTRGERVIFSSASETLINGLLTLLIQIKIKSIKSKWKNSKLNRFFFDLLIKEKDKFMNILPQTKIKLNPQG